MDAANVTRTDIKHFVTQARQILIFGERKEYDAAYKRLLAKFLDGKRLTHKHFEYLAEMGDEGAELLNRLLSEYRRKVKYAAR